MKIVITGAHGFVGAALCRYFHRAGHSIIAVGRQPNPQPNLLKYATYISLDITKPLPIFEADVCIHAAGLASETAAYPELYQHNVTGTENVVMAAVNCQYFIQISSSSVYAFQNHAMQEHEADINANLSDYGKTKLLAEQVVKKNFPTGQKRLILRPRAIYGIGDRVLLPRLLTLANGNKIYCPVPELVQTSLTQVENIGYAISLFLTQQNQPVLQIFNIADDPLYNLRNSIIKIIEALYQKSFRKIYIPPQVLKSLASLNKYMPISPQLNPFVLSLLTQSSVLDISKIKKELNYAPAFTFNNTIPDISQWVTSLGGVNEYLQNSDAAPWNIPDLIT